LSLAGEIGRAGTWVVGFTGGEVFLWPHLFEVIRVLKQHRLPVYIVTNGLLLKEMTDEILASGVDYVVVSLDSDNPREHDFLRSCPGLFDRAVEGIQHLKRKRTVKMPVIKSTTLLTRMSLPRMGEIIDNLARIVDVAAIQPIVNNEANCPHRCSEKIADLLFFPSSERREAEELIARFSRAHPAYDNAYIRNITTYWFDPDSLVDAIHCWSPFLRLVVMPNGDVFHCTFNPRYPAVGNVNRSSLMEIWNSPEMRRQREEIRLQRNRCICWTQDSSFNVLLKNTPLANRLPVLNRMDRQNRYVGSPPH
jgi:MoaA/NifB/PqqE/SkfB family radical SAM enzyme